MNTNDFNPDEDVINFNLPEYNYLQNNVDLITIDDLNKMIKKLIKVQSHYKLTIKHQKNDTGYFQPIIGEQ